MLPFLKKGEEAAAETDKLYKAQKESHFSTDAGWSAWKDEAWLIFIGCALKPQ